MEASLLERPSTAREQAAGVIRKAIVEMRLKPGARLAPQNVLATLYGHLGIDPTTTLIDFTGRPQPLLDDCTPIKELL